METQRPSHDFSLWTETLSGRRGRTTGVHDGILQQAVWLMGKRMAGAGPGEGLWARESSSVAAFLGGSSASESRRQAMTHVGSTKPDRRAPKSHTQPYPYPFSATHSLHVQLQ